MRQQFSTAPVQFLLRQELTNRRQKENETLEQYTEDIHRRCARLGVRGNELRDIYVQGLLSEIKTHVILNQPQTTEEAETMARLKSSVMAGTSKLTGMAELKKAVSSLRDSLSPKSEMQELRDEIERIKHLSSTPQRRSNNTPVSAYYNSEKTKGHLHGNQYEANSQIHQLQEDLRRVKSQLSQLQVTNNRNGRQYRPTLRNKRSTTGAPICYSCRRVGHISRNCRGFLQDPRIPQQQRFGTSQVRPEPMARGQLRHQSPLKPQASHQHQGN